MLRAGREKYKESVGRPPSKLLSTTDNSYQPEEKHNTQKELAKEVGVSTGKFASAEIVRKKEPELWQKAKDGEITR